MCGLDGFVSRMYAPENGVEQLDGDFGVMIGVVKCVIKSFCFLAERRLFL